MKLDRSTKILLNLALILVIALFLKQLVTIPKTYAAIGPEYKVSSVEQEFANYMSDAKRTKFVRRLVGQIDIEREMDIPVQLESSKGLEIPQLCHF